MNFKLIMYMGMTPLSLHLSSSRSKLNKLATSMPPLFALSLSVKSELPASSVLVEDQVMNGTIRRT